MWKKEAYIWEPWDLMNNISDLKLKLLAVWKGQQVQTKNNKTLQKTCLFSQKTKKDTL